VEQWKGFINQGSLKGEIMGNFHTRNELPRPQETAGKRSRWSPERKKEKVIEVRGVVKKREKKRNR